MGTAESASSSEPSLLQKLLTQHKSLKQNKHKHIQRRPTNRASPRTQKPGTCQKEPQSCRINRHHYQDTETKHKSHRASAGDLVPNATRTHRSQTTRADAGYVS